MVDADLVGRMIVQIALGTPKENFGEPLDADADALWDEMAAEVAEITTAGGGVETVAPEVPDLPDWIGDAPAAAEPLPEAGQPATDGPVTAAADAPPTGAMVALVPADPAALAIDHPAAEPAEALHLTLAFLGDAADWTPEQQQALGDALGQLTALPAAEADGFGVNYWNPGSDDPSWVLAVGGDGLDDLHGHVWEVLRNLEAEPAIPALPEQHSPWVPHVCLAYSADETVLDAALGSLGPVSFDRLRLAFGEVATDYPLGAVREAESETAGGTPMPWHVDDHAADCPPSDPYGVINEADGSTESCHPTREEADAQLADLQAAEPGAQAQAVPLDSPVVSGNGKPGQAGAWAGTLAVEGIRTRESPAREFTPGALEWAELPLPLRWRMEDSHGGADLGGGVVLTGRIDRIWREAPKVMASGVLDLDGEHGREVHRLMAAGMLRGVSIDADDITDADVELVWPEGHGEEAGDGLDELLAVPETLRFHHGRIRAATLVDLPAFDAATVALTDPAALAATGFADAAWDGDAAMARCSNSDSPASCFRGICAARVAANPADTQAGWALPHHNTPDGPAVPKGVSSALGYLDRTQGIDKAAARRHLERHAASARAAAGTRTAARHGLTALNATAAVSLTAPPAPWFANPRLRGYTAVTATEALRVYGHAAPWDVCHVGIADVCVQAPREEDHPFFLTGEVVCADGSRVPVGQITLATGHAPLDLPARPAAAHYDDTGTVVADVAVGNDQWGIWVAGAIRPGATPEQVHALRASGRVSGDWRMIGGRLRLVALLAVNVPGLPFPRTSARVASGRVLTLVGAARPVTSPAAGHRAALRRVADRIAADVGLDRASRRAAAVDRVRRAGGR